MSQRRKINSFNNADCESSTHFIIKLYQQLHPIRYYAWNSHSRNEQTNDEKKTSSIPSSLKAPSSFAYFSGKPSNESVQQQPHTSSKGIRKPGQRWSRKVRRQRSRASRKSSGRSTSRTRTRPATTTGAGELHSFLYSKGYCTLYKYFWCPKHETRQLFSIFVVVPRFPGVGSITLI